MAVNISDLTLGLKPLVGWKPFGLQLKGLNFSEVDKIDQSVQSIDDKKIALYTKWLASNPDASWEDVVDSLKKNGENTLAKEIENEYVVKKKPDTFLPSMETQPTTDLPSDPPYLETAHSVQDTSMVAQLATQMYTFNLNKKSHDHSHGKSKKFFNLPEASAHTNSGENIYKKPIQSTSDGYYALQIKIHILKSSVEYWENTAQKYHEESKQYEFDLIKERRQSTTQIIEMQMKTQAEFNQLKADFASLEQENNCKDEKIQSQYKIIEDLEEQLKAVQTEIERITNEQTIKVQRIQAQETEINLLRRQMEQMEETLSREREISAQLKKRCEQLTSENQKLTEKTLNEFNKDMIRE